MSAYSFDNIRCSKITGPVSISALGSTSPLSIPNIDRVSTGTPIGIIGYDEQGIIRPIDIQSVFPIYGSEVFDYNGTIPLISSDASTRQSELLRQSILRVKPDDNSTGTIRISAIYRCDTDADPISVETDTVVQLPIANESVYLHGTVFINTTNNVITPSIHNTTYISTYNIDKLPNMIGGVDKSTLLTGDMPLFHPYLDTRVDGGDIYVDIVGMFPSTVAIVKIDILSTSML